MKDIILDISYGQIRAAVIENQELAEVYMEEEENRSIVGNIYKGKVENVLSGMQAAFVNIGTDKNGFLHIKDITSDFCDCDDASLSNDSVGDICICELLKSGQDILVQIVKEPIDTKGARITTNITLPGRYVVLMPLCNYVGVSKRIKDNDERERLREIARKVKPENMGVIIRTVAENSSLNDIETEVGFLQKLWERLIEENERKPSPCLIHKDMNLFYRIIRDMFAGDVNSMIINNPIYYKKALKIAGLKFPNLKERIKYFDKTIGIFDYFHLENKIEMLINKKVWLESGGYIIIEQTEALTAIDVNTGKYVGGKDLVDTVYKTNIEAAREIPKQLRLRDIGGIIIIDYIDMHDEEQQKTVIEVMRNALKKDKSKSCVWGMTHIGLLEMTREKIVAPKEDMMLSQCPYCSGMGKILSPKVTVKKIESEIRNLLAIKNRNHIEIHTHPLVKELLMEDYRNFFNHIKRQYKIRVKIIPKEELNIDKYKILL